MFQPDFRNSAGEEQEARKKLTSFCTQVINGLIAIEKKTSNRPSTLKHFCRLDIGVINKDGELYYFVNEVTRVVEVSLFSGTLRDIDFIKMAGSRAFQSMKVLVEYKEKET